MFRFFDYIFFRVFSYYERKNNEVPIDRGIQFLSIVQVFIVFDILMMGDFDFIKSWHLNKYSLGIPLAVLVIFFNEMRYKKIGKLDRFLNFKMRWEEEDKGVKKVKGWLIGFLPVFLLFGIPIIIWFVKKRV